MPKDNYADIIESIRPKTVVHPMNKSKDDFSDIVGMLGIEGAPITEPSLSPEIGRVLSSGFDTEFPIPDSGSGKWTNKISPRQKPINPNVASEGYIFSPQQEQDLAVELGKQGKGAKEIIEELNKRRAYTPIPGAAGQKKGYFGGVTQEKGVLPSLARVGAELPANVLGGILGKVPDVKDQSVLESIGKAFTGFAGFLVGPMGAAKKIIGNMWAVREGSIAANYARQLGRGGLELGTASALSRTIPATEKYGPSIKAAGDIGKAFGQGAVFSAIFNVSGVIPTKPLRIATGAALTDLLRGGGQFTIDDTIKGIQDGTIDKQELTDRVFGYTMDIFFLSTTPSIKQRIESLMPFKRVDKLAAMVASNKMKQGKYQEAVAIVKNRFEKIKNDPEIRDKMSELVGKELSEIQKETMKEQAKTPKGRQDIIDEFAPEELETTLKLNAQKRQAEIDQMMVEAEVPVEEAPKVAKAVKAPETAMQQIERLVGEIKAFGKEIGYKPPLERGKLQVPVGKKKPVDTKLIEQDKRVQGVLSEIEKLEGLRATAEKATGMDLKSFYDKAIDDAIAVLPPGEKIELQSAVSNFRKKVYVTGIEKYYADKKAEAEAVKVAEKKKETAPVMGKEKPPAKRTMEELVDAGDIPAPEYEGKERRAVSEARQTIIDGYIKKELGGKDLSGKKLAPLTRSEKEVLDLYEAKHPDYVGKVREAMKGREGEPEKKAPAKAKTPEEVAKDHGVEYDGIQKGVEGKNFYTFTDKETGSTFNVKDLSEVKNKLSEMRKKFKEEEVKTKVDAELSETETQMAELGKLTPAQLVERAKAAGLEQTVWSKALSDRRYVERRIVGEELKPSKVEVESRTKIEPEVKSKVEPKVSQKSFDRIKVEKELGSEGNPINIKTDKYDIQYWVDSDAPVLHIEHLFVKPKYRGQKIGSKLIDDLVEKADKFRLDIRIFSYTESPKNNLQFIKLLERRGFKREEGISDSDILEGEGRGESFGVLMLRDAKVEPEVKSELSKEDKSNKIYRGTTEERLKLSPQGKATFYTTDKEAAKEYADIGADPDLMGIEYVEKPKVVESINKLKNPASIEDIRSVAKKGEFDYYEDLPLSSLDQPGLVDLLIKEGFDGAIGRDTSPSGKKIISVAVFETKSILKYRLQKLLAQDKLTQEDVKWLKENRDALDLSKEETQAIKMRIAGNLVKRIISEEKFQKNSESIKKYLRGLKVFTGVPEPKIIRALGENAIYHIERGVTDFYQWSKGVIKQFGEKIRPYLHNAWKNAQEGIKLGDPFYSQMSRTLDKKIQGKFASIDQVRGILKDVSAEEVRWSGIEEFLDNTSQSKWGTINASAAKISKQELMNFIAENSIKIEEVKRGKVGKTKHEEVLNLLPGYENYQEITYNLKDRRSFKEVERLIGTTRWKLNQLVAEEDTVPFKREFGRTSYEGEVFTTNLDRIIREGRIPIKMASHLQLLKELGFKVGKVYVPDPTKIRLGSTRTRMIVDLKFQDVKFTGQIYYEDRIPTLFIYDQFRRRISHFYRIREFLEKNAITKKDTEVATYSVEKMHEAEREVRLLYNLKKLTKGPRIKLIKEFEKGFKSHAFPEEDTIGWSLLTDRTIEGKKYLHLEEQQSDYAKAIKRGKTEDAPLVRKHQEYALKRLMRMAVEEGYDGLSWSSGKIVKDRWRLSNYIDKLFVNVSEEGLYNLIGYKEGISAVNKSGITENELPDYIGKELSKRVSEGNREFTGIDLDMGGQWAEAFYDKIIPNFVDKYVKKWGAKVEDVKFKTNVDNYPEEVVPNIYKDGNRYRIKDWETGENLTEDIFNTKGDAQRWIDVHSMTPVKSVSFTPEMRFDITIKGQPLFGVPKGRQFFVGEADYFKSLNNIKKYFKGEKPYGEKLHAGIGLDPQLVTDVARVMRFHIEKGTKDFYRVSQELIKEFGEGIKPYLKTAWKDAQYITNYRGVRELKDNIWVSGIGSQTEGKGVYTALTKEQAANFGEKVIEVKYKKPKSERVLRVINEELPLLDQTEFSQTKPFEKDDTIWIRSNKEAYQKAIESSSKFVNELTKEERDIINRNVKYKKNPMYTEIMIDNFMENNLGNILKDKGYDVIEIRDRHGVKGYGWNVILNKDLIITSGSGYDKSLANIKAYFKGEKPYGEKLYSGLPLDPELVTDVARVIRFKMEAGAKDFYKTSQELIKEFGEKVRPYLKPAWDKAKGQIEVATMNKKDLKSANDALVKMGLKTLSEVEAENISPEIVNEPGLIKRFMSTLESTDQTLEAYKGGAQEHINAVPRIMVEETFIPKQIWLVDKFKQLNTVMKGVRRSIKAGELSRVGKEANKLGQEVSEVLELKDITEATGKYSPRSIEIAKDVRKILDEILVELQDANVLDKKGKLIKRLEGYFPHITKETNMTEELQQYLNDALEGRHDDIIGAASGGVDLYGTAKPVPKFGHAERRAAEDYGLKDIETNPLRVLRRYVLAASRILYDKPGIEKARAEIERIPAGSMKDLSVKYIQNYMRISDSISGTLRLIDAKLARMGARSVLAFSTGLQTLHLGRIATQVWPELGTRYSFAGLYELVANPSKAWAETRDAGLLPQSSIPSRFKFRGEVFDKLSGYGDFGNSIAKIIAYQGFLRKVFNQHPDWTFKQIQTEAVKQTIRAEGVVSQATKSIAIEKIPKFFLQFVYWFQKYGENSARAVAGAAKDPSMENMTRVGKYLIAAAITEEITRQTGLKIFHITPYLLQLSATGAGYLKDIAWILANDKDSIETRLEKAFKRTAEYGIPGGVSIPRELNPKTGPTAIKKHK